MAGALIATKPAEDRAYITNVINRTMISRISCFRSNALSSQINLGCDASVTDDNAALAIARSTDYTSGSDRSPVGDRDVGNPRNIASDTVDRESILILRLLLRQE